MDLSFREKSAVVSLLAVLGTYGYYFYFVLLGAGPDSPAEMLSWMIGLIVVLVVIEVVFHIVIAGFDHRETERPADERERLISLKAFRVGYLVLCGFVLLALGRTLFGSVFAPEEVSLLEIANLLLLGLVLAEVANYGVQLYHFRRGVS